ncbi:hypothetical protein PLIIFM63780_010561 [Purpureocillium lilacinum]|nr:hypothetical protein PLIIFM63780_010561 [Purpureocillium lilacinum]
MAARPSRQSAASTGKRRRDSSDENTPAKAARKQFEEGQTTLEQAKPYRILTARMPLDALTADWSLARNRSLQAKHVDALYTIFERGDMKRASYPLAVLSTRSEVQRMLHGMGYDSDTPDADDVPSFDGWLSVNRRPVELLDGQHRVAALKRLVYRTGAGEEELHWPCNFYDRDELPPQLNLELRMNRRDPTMADNHGDIWVQLVTAASETPGIFQGTVDKMKEQMRDTLRLSSDTGFPLSRLAAVWRNERWRQMTTRWCETAVGRATFQITTWDWMICNRIDDFWFMAFRHVLDTLAQLPGDAAKLVSSEDWKKMSASLGAERTREQVQELFYPRQSGKPLSVASKRNPKLLQSFDARGYWDIYERVLHTPALRFEDVHRITGLSQGQGRVLFQVIDHVVNWLNPERTIVVDRRSNTKPQLRLDLEQKLDYYTLTRLRQAEKRVKIFHPSAAQQLPRASASVLLQQEVLEFVLEHLADFNALKTRHYLKDANPDSALYAARFGEDTWAGVLKIVRWHVSECRPKWLPVEGSDKPPEAEPSTQAANLTDAFCNYAAGLTAVREDEGLYSKLQSSAFRTALATWLSEQCGEEPDSKEMRSDDGAPGSNGSHADDDGSTVVVAAAAAAKAPEVDSPVVDPKPAAKPAAKPDATRNATRDATRDAPVPLLDRARRMADGRPDRDGGRKALTDKAQGNGTAQAPARKKQRDRLVSCEGQQRGPKTVTPQRQAASNGWVEPPPVRSSLSCKPGPPGRALTKRGRASLGDMLAQM